MVPRRQGMQNGRVGVMNGKIVVKVELSHMVILRDLLNPVWIIS